MLNYFQAIIFGAVQGVTELFPISSLGHSVILPKLFGWNIDQKDPFFLTFLVATHVATAIVLFLFFWKDWKRIFAGIFRSLKEREISEHDSEAKMGWLLIVGTIPAGILGLLFEDPLKALFASPQLVAGVLILNGCMLYIAELLRRRKKDPANGSDKRIAKLTWFQTVKIGLLQCLALIPGFSRTGAAITGGLLVGLTHEDAARFSFLLATPIIGAAAVLKLPELLTPAEMNNIGPTLVGALSAGIFAYFSVRFLTKYFETKRLTPFAVYCVTIGVIVSLLFLVR
jgi:undecaprenyl-diphosphatase